MFPALNARYTLHCGEEAMAMGDYDIKEMEQDSCENEKSVSGSNERWEC